MEARKSSAQNSENIFQRPVFRLVFLWPFRRKLYEKQCASFCRKKSRANDFGWNKKWSNFCLPLYCFWWEFLGGHIKSKRCIFHPIKNAELLKTSELIASAFGIKFTRLSVQKFTCFPLNEATLYFISTKIQFLSQIYYEKAYYLLTIGENSTAKYFHNFHLGTCIAYGTSESSEY